MSDDVAFWIVNVSDRNVCLGDLAITIPARRSLNLLGKKTQLTLEQIELSVKSGSIFTKSDKIKIRVNPPVEAAPQVIIVEKTPRPGKKRSLVEIIEKRYTELIYSDEQFVAELSDIDNPTEPPK